MVFFDAHVHFLWTGPFENVQEGWKSVVAQGLKGIAGIIKVNAPEDPEQYLKLIPAAYHHDLDSGFLGKGSRAHASAARELGRLEVLAYLDCRFLTKNDADLSTFVPLGFKGLKVLYVPEEDEGLELVGWEKFFGRTVEESRELVWSLIDQAVRLRWPVLMHVNLKRYREFAAEVLGAYPDHPFIIPHFGLSRKIMTGFLEKFSACYTDFASLLSFMREDPQGYLGFVTAFQNRVLFGTDATLGHPEWVLEYRDFVVDLIRDEEVRDKVLRANYVGLHSLGR
jgi:hypothetical protein